MNLNRRLFALVTFFILLTVPMRLDAFQSASKQKSGKQTEKKETKGQNKPSSDNYEVKKSGEAVKNQPVTLPPEKKEKKEEKKKAEKKKNQ